MNTNCPAGRTPRFSRPAALGPSLEGTSRGIRPGTSGTRCRKAKYYSYVVTLSPRHGYAIIETDRITRVEKGAGQPPLEIHDRKQVVDFQEPRPASSCPSRIRVSRTRSDSAVNPQYLGENVIHDVHVNGPDHREGAGLPIPARNRRRRRGEKRSLYLG